MEEEDRDAVARAQVLKFGSDSILVNLIHPTRLGSGENLVFLQTC